MAPRHETAHALVTAVRRSLLADGYAGLIAVGRSTQEMLAGRFELLTEVAHEAEEATGERRSA